MVKNYFLPSKLNKNFVFSTSRNWELTIGA